MCFWIFDTKQIKNNQKQQTNKAFKQPKKKMLECEISKQPTMSYYIERINAWTCYNAYAREQAKPIDAQSH